MHDVIKVKAGGDAGGMCRQRLLPLLPRSAMTLNQSPQAIAINLNSLPGQSLVDSINFYYAMAYRKMQYAR